MKKLLKLLFLLLASFLVLTSCMGEEVEETKENVESEAELHPSDLDGQLVVMVDPGHGFGDVGCTSEYIDCYEKDINLSVALKLKESLEAKGVTVILSHDGESFMNENDIISACDRLGIEYKSEYVKENNIFYAYERALLANVTDEEMGIDMFVSLHVNSLEQEYVSGYQMFWCSENPEAERIEKLCGEIKAELDNDCTLKAYDADNAYIVTKYGTFPSFLLEMGYATNPDDAKKLTDENWQSSLADLLAEKIYASISEASVN